MGWFFGISGGYKDPDEFKDVFPAAVDAIVYGKEDPVGKILQLMNS